MLISRYTGRNSSLTIFKPVVKSTTTNMNRFFGASSARIKVTAAVVPRPETTVASTRPEPVLTDCETAVLPPLPPPLSSRFQSILTLKLKLIASLNRLRLRLLKKPNACAINCVMKWLDWLLLVQSRFFVVKLTQKFMLNCLNN